MQLKMMMRIMDVDCADAVKVMVDNDKEFLLSLAKIGAIRLLERADSCLFNSEGEYGSGYVDVS